MQVGFFFPYSWHLDEDEEEITSIRIYGLDDKNKNICLRVDNFTPYIYIELPNNIKWNTTKAQLVGNKLDELIGDQKPLRKKLQMKKKLYGAYIDINGKRKLFPYLFCSFSHPKDIKTLSYKLHKHIYVANLGALKLKIHESSANPILQLTCCRELPTAGWIKFCGKEMTNDDDKLTLCDHEFKVKWKNLSPHNSNIVPKPKIMGFDIEVNSTNPSTFPKPERPGDKVFQISCILTREGDQSDDYEKYLLTLGQPDQETVGEDVKISMFNTEAALLEGFTKFIRKENPNLIVGYNILGFDIPYMIARAKLNLCIFNFDQQGFHKFAHAREKIIKWSSSAYKNQEFEFLDAEGRVYVDLLPLVRRDFKFNNYQLKTISEYFLDGLSKDPLSVKGIFKCYRIGVKKNKKNEYGARARKAMGIVGKYCVKDSVLVVRLVDKLKTWVGLTEMAKTMNVTIFTLYTQGQQIKVYSQLYRYCTYQNIVVESDGYRVAEDERYVGAKVFPPIPGRYKMVVPFDFASLYPTTIIAYNIDYHTWVPDGSNIPNSKCHIMNWEDHLGCSHDPKIIRKEKLTLFIEKEQVRIKKLRDKRNKTLDKLRKKELMQQITAEVEQLKPYTLERAELRKTISKFPMCCKRSYRFLKEPKGVMPTVIQNLLDARKHTRKVDMRNSYKKIDELKDEEQEKGIDNSKLIQIEKSLIDVLNKRQLAYKVASNSMYGAMGVKRGYLPFMPGAMCTTYMGRINIEIVAKIIPEKYGGELVYGDSVSEDTPILCRINDKICYRTIDNLPQRQWKIYRDDKQEAIPYKVEVWTEHGFTKVKKVIRHKTSKEIFRILTHTGVVDVTEDHGLLDKASNKISPKEIIIGTELLTVNLPQLESDSLIDITEDLAFVMGFFYADGSCGVYNCKSGTKASWALNNQNRQLLEKCQQILNNHYNELTFKILETMKSSGVLKLVPKGKVKIFIKTWRQMFYDQRKYKIVPDYMLWSAKNIRQSFLDGYYAGDGDKDKNNYYRFDNKGKIGAAGLYLIAYSLGYKVSINARNDKPNVYRLTCTKNKQRRKEDAVKKIISLGSTEQYVYDLETENHHFSAGIGKLIVHNTDSNYIHFPHLKTAQETWDHAIFVADEVTKLFPSPIRLEFEEEIYSFFFILSKKRYMYRKCLRDGIIETKIGKKGVLLARRDNSKFIRDIYEYVINQIADNVSRDDILFYVITKINELCSALINYNDFIITKSVGSSGDLQAIPFINEKGVRKAKVGNYIVSILSSNKEEREQQLVGKGAKTVSDFYLLSLPAPVQLAEKIRQRGTRVDVGTRLEYIVTNPEKHTAKQYEKIESAEYFAKHREVIKIDFFYYLKALIIPLDQVLDVAFGKTKDFKLQFVLNQYNFRYKIRNKVLCQLKSLFSPRLLFED